MARSLSLLSVAPSDFSDDELVRTVEGLRKQNKILEMENFIFENFLLKVEPKLLLGIQAILDQAGRIQGQLDQVTKSSHSSQDVLLRSKSIGSLSSSYSKISSMTLNDLSKRINLNTRLELLTKERNLYTTNIEKHYESVRKKRNNLRAELEEIDTRISEIKDARVIFEQSVVKDALDPITQRIPAEKFIRYMEEWLKCADSTIEKLRLRTDTLKYKRIFIQNQLKQKEELGESLHPVDLDQLKIDNRELTKRLEQKNVDLLDLKKRSGEANLILNKTKRFLLEQSKILRNVSNDTTAKQKKSASLELEIQKVKKEVRVSEQNLHKLIKLDQTYIVPDVVDYIKLKGEIFRLKHDIKIWERKSTVQTSALETLINNMKRISNSDPSNAWFLPPQQTAPDEFDDETV